MPTIQCKRKSAELQALLDEKAERLGRQSGFVKRHSKMSAAHFAQTLTLGWLDNAEATLNELVQVSEDLGVAITPAGLHQRFTEEAVSFLQALVQEAIAGLGNDERLPGKLFAPFEAVHIVDSSIITLPPSVQSQFAGFASEGSEAAIKFQLCYDYLSGQLCALQAGDGRQPDQACHLLEEHSGTDILSLFDLGYFNQATLAMLDDSGGYFVCRYKYGTHVYATPHAPAALDLLTILQTYAGDRYEMECWVGSRCRVGARLIAQRLPDDLVQERRRKARAAARKKGHTPPAAYLALLAWSLYLSNAPAAYLSFDDIVTLYRVRWQIELVFKVWKSQARLDQIMALHPQRVLCQLYARLLGVILFHWLIAPWRVWHDRELSMPKAFGVLRRNMTRLLDSIAANWLTTASVLARISTAFTTHASKDRRSACGPFSYQSTYRQLVPYEA